jgi:hypothetical protein
MDSSPPFTPEALFYFLSSAYASSTGDNWDYITNYLRSNTQECFETLIAIFKDETIPREVRFQAGTAFKNKVDGFWRGHE